MKVEGEDNFNLLSPEEELLLLACRLKLSETQLSRVKELCEIINNWNYFEERCASSLIGPFVYSILIRKHKISFPSNVEKSLTSLSARVLANNVLIMNEYEHLIDLLQKENIVFIPLKGVYLLNKHNELFETRLTSDIDILVHPNEEKHIRNLLFEEKYSERLTLPIKLSILTLNPTPYNYDRNGVTLDLHYRMNRLEGFSIDFETVWRSAEQTADTTQRNLTGVDRIVHLCTHAFTHFQIFDFKIASLADIIMEMVELQDLPSILERSKQFGCLKEVASMLYLLNEFFDVSVPADTFECLNEEEKEMLSKRFLLFLRGDRAALREKYHTTLNRFRQFTPHLNFIQKVRFVYYFAFPEKQYLQEYFGSKSNRFSLLSRYLISQLQKLLF